MSHSLAFIRPAEIDFPDRTVANPSSSTQFVSCDTDWLVCGNEDGYFFTFLEGIQRYSFNVLPHVPAKLKISAVRSLICIATRTGTILVYELATGKFLKLLDLKQAVLQELVVSREFGFIVAFSRDQLVTFTENGSKMYTVELKIATTLACCFDLCDGRDFALAVTEDNEVFCFEVFRPEIKLVTKFTERVMDLSYSYDLVGVVAVTGDGFFHFIPFRPG
jgi:hypothetical protein